MTATMTTDERSLRAAICADPADDLPRLVFADWLDEQGRHERAQFIRVQCELGRAPKCLRDGRPVGIEDGTAVPRAIGVRYRPYCRCRPCSLARHESRLWNRHGYDTFRAEALAGPMAARQQAVADLFEQDPEPLDRQYLALCDRFDWVSSPDLLTWQRGFVVGLRLPSEPFEEWAGHLFLSQPIEWVEITDINRSDPLARGIGGAWVFDGRPICLDSSGNGFHGTAVAYGSPTAGGFTGGMSPYGPCTTFAGTKNYTIRGQPHDAVAYGRRLAAELAAHIERDTLPVTGGGDTRGDRTPGPG